MSQSGVHKLNRKQKQRIGDDPRNTRWAKNQSNPGFKILSSMGWSPSTTSLGAASASSEPIQSTWKRLPTSALPIFRPSTSGLGANPNQACSSTYLSGPPRFVPGSQLTPDPELDPARTTPTPMTGPSIESHQDRSSKLSIVTAGGGGFDDLLTRLNKKKSVNKATTITTGATHHNLSSSEADDLNDQSFVVVLEDPSKKSLQPTPSDQIAKETVGPKQTKRVRILEFRRSVSSLELDQPKKKKSRRSKGESVKADDRLLSSNPKDYYTKTLKRFGSASSKKSKRKLKLLSGSSSTSTHRSDHQDRSLPIGHGAHSPPHPQAARDDEDDELVETSAGPLRISRPINPRVAARAKFIKSKKLASSTQNAAAMAEILGIPP